MSKIWRRFRPSPGRLQKLGGDVFARAEQLVAQQPIPKRHMWQRRDYSALNSIIHSLLEHGEKTYNPEMLLASLILQAPRAVSAQKKMDKHPHGFHDKEARLDELITFNDTYVSAILALEPYDRKLANERIKQRMDQFCKQLHATAFSNEQWEAITHGLSREIAVYIASRELGYDTQMTSRRADALGVDMVMVHPLSGRRLNIDVKTRSSFHFRLIDLAREGRISERQREAAEYAGYCVVVNGHGEEAIQTTLLRIDEETYGRVIDFRLERPEILGEKLKQIVR